MIVRVWRGVAEGAGVERYHRHVTGRVFPELRKLPGHLAGVVLRRVVAGETEVVVVTAWESMAAVEAFAGTDVGKAVVEPEARAALTRFDDFVTHYDVAYCDPFDLPAFA